MHAFFEVLGIGGDIEQQASSKTVQYSELKYNLHVALNTDSK